jgi:hypothetical protein
MPSENSGPPVRKTQPQSDAAQAAQAAAAKAAAARAETERETRRAVEAAAAARRAQAAAEALAAAQRVPVRDAHTPLPPPPPPYVYPGHYGQTLPSVGGGGSTDDKKKDKDKIPDVVVIPPMDTTPEPVAPITPAPVRTPTRNVVNLSDLVPQFSPEHIQKILFENVSAIELSIVERHDTIEGINQRYSIISNLSEIRKKYDAAKQLSIMDKFNPLTSIYTINIEDKIPQEDYIRLEELDSTYQYLDENNQLVTREKGYYYIDINGDLVIELINLERSQEVEIYIDTNGTIYKVES